MTDISEDAAGADSGTVAESAEAAEAFLATFLTASPALVDTAAATSAGQCGGGADYDDLAWLSDDAGDADAGGTNANGKRDGRRLAGGQPGARTKTQGSPGGGPQRPKVFYNTHPVRTFTSGPEARDAAKVWNGFNWAASFGALARIGDAVTYTCIDHQTHPGDESHPPGGGVNFPVACGARLLIRFMSADCVEMWESMTSHGTHHLPLPDNFNGISGEFIARVDALVLQNKTPGNIHAALLLDARWNKEPAMSRVPTKQKITARSTKLKKSESYAMTRNADLVQWATKRLVVNHEQYTKLPVNNDIIVFDIYTGTIRVVDKSAGATSGATVEVNCVSLVWSTKALCEQLVAARADFGEVKDGKFVDGDLNGIVDGTYKLASGNAVSINQTPLEPDRRA
jgi:hypothetical protein